jgi:hypothetical protein
MTTEPKAKFTPGPWHIVTDSADRSVIKSTTQPEKPHSVIVADSWVKQADARLIAAAPELLEALREILEWAQIPSDGSKTAVAIKVKAEAAISKAEKGAQ